jgi:hypothetical protein
MATDAAVQQRLEDILTRARGRAERIASLRGAMVGAMAAPAPPPGILLAEGDSWFDYPGSDVLNELEDVFGYEIVSVAHAGDTVESMAYGERQLDGFNRKAERIAAAGRKPRAILLSGGGNDIAGEEFVLLLNHSRSGLDPLNRQIVEGLLEERLRAAYVFLIRTIGAICAHHYGDPAIPVIVHGYDRPVPDGRGFLGGWGPLPGPWLRPGFDRKGYRDLAGNTDIMARLIGSFNAMLATLPAEPGLGHVRHVDLQGTLTNVTVDNAYRTDWDNELHPEERGFAKVAVRLHQAIADL